MIYFIFFCILALVFAVSVGLFDGNSPRVIAILLLVSIGANAQNNQQPIPYNSPTNIFESHYEENYDGDSYHFWVLLPTFEQGKDYKVEEVTCRLNIGDTNEITGGTEETRKKAQEAKQFAARLLINYKFKIQYLGKDWRGKRWTVRIHFEDGETMFDKLKQAGHLTGRFEASRARRRIRVKDKKVRAYFRGKY